MTSTRPRRLLFVVPPLAGHINPTIALGEELAARGHTVAWAGYQQVTGELLPSSATFLPVAKEVPRALQELAKSRPKRGTFGGVAFKTSWEQGFLPIARDMLPGLHAVVEDFNPDVLVADQQTVAAPAVAELRDLPWATSATTSAEIVDPYAAMPKVGEWVRAQLTAWLTEAGVDPETARTVDPRFSPHLVLAFTTRALLGYDQEIPPQTVLVGPSVAAGTRGRADRSEVDGDARRPGTTTAAARAMADWLDQSGPHVLISLGTLNWRSGERFFRVAAQAMGGMDLRAIIVAPPAMIPDPPPNVLVRERVPQVDLLPHMDAVVSHGGHNTVCETLAHGVPLVLAPIRDDQPYVASQVTRAGAAVRVLFSRVTPAKLQEAVSTVLHEPQYRQAAGRVRASFEAAGGPAEAADHLEKLIDRAPSSPGNTNRSEP